MKSETDKYPLRIIVKEFTQEKQIGEYTLCYSMEELECGHVVKKHRYKYGFKIAKRRRCKECYLKGINKNET